MVYFGNDWDEILKDEFSKEYYQKLRDFLKTEYATYTVYPSMYDIYNALRSTAYKDVKVVIIGQDPYHEPGQAHGLCFSVMPGTKFPPSLMNIFQELQSDLGVPVPPTGNLEGWARQGVLLLNATLTVRAHQAGSHQRHGWETFTDAAISRLSEKRSGIVFLLWGSYAQAKAQLIDASKHYILTAPHPSPLSAYRGFFGCRHFSQTNQILVQNGQEPIHWERTT